MRCERVRVYIVNKDLDLIVFKSISDFESKNSWIDSSFINCVTTNEIKSTHPLQDSNDGFFVQLSNDELSANRMINNVAIQLGFGYE